MAAVRVEFDSKVESVVQQAETVILASNSQTPVYTNKLSHLALAVFVAQNAAEVKKQGGALLSHDKVDRPT